MLFATQQCISKVKAILVSQHGVPQSVSHSTIYRAARKQMDGAAPSKEPLLTAANRAKRVALQPKKQISTQIGAQC